MIQPQNIEINGKTYILSKLPALAGREIMTQYPTTALPKIGDYKSNEQLCFKLLAYVGINAGGNIIQLSTPELINNHVQNWEDCLRLEYEMLKYNCSFLQDGRVSTLLEKLVQWLQPLITKTWMASSDLSSQTVKQPFTN